MNKMMRPTTHLIQYITFTFASLEHRLSKYSFAQKIRREKYFGEKSLKSTKSKEHKRHVKSSEV